MDFSIIIFIIVPAPRSCGFLPLKLSLLVRMNPCDHTIKKTPDPNRKKVFEKQPALANSGKNRFGFLGVAGGIGKIFGDICLLIGVYQVPGLFHKIAVSLFALVKAVPPAIIRRHHGAPLVGDVDVFQVL
jgi:hypothetical protein